MWLAVLTCMGRAASVYVMNGCLQVQGSRVVALVFILCSGVLSLACGGTNPKGRSPLLLCV